MDTPALHLVDMNPAVVEAWVTEFRGFPEVEILRGDILDVAKCAIVSPSNSSGFMDGGIDRVYTKYFGLRPQTELQDAIAKRPDEELPVGASVLVSTGHDEIPFMICAPTMKTPGPVPGANAFYAMSAVLISMTIHKRQLSDVYCPGLCTDVGEVAPDESAREVAHAYKKWKQHSAT